ncbi:MAG: hypothetical protein R3B81_14835 [bacterium]
MQWNAGGWFGAQLGCTCWMLVAGLLAARHHLSTGLLTLGLFALPNVVGLALWFGRKLSVYASIQTLVLTAGLCGVAAVWVLDRGGVWSTIQTGGQVSTTSTYGMLAGTVVFLLILFRQVAARNETRR